MRSTTVCKSVFALGLGAVMVLGLSRQGATESKTPGEASALATRVRQPVALAFVDDGKRLLVANRRSGTISIVDTQANAVVAERAIGGTPSDLVAISGNDRFLLATDDERHRLILLERKGIEVDVAAQVDVAPYPVSVRLTGDGRHAVVASLWSRQLTVIGLDGAADRPSLPVLKIERTIALPFAPRCQLWLPEARRLVVTDSFGGNLAVVDPATGTIESVRTIPGHNIRGLALNVAGDRLLVSHQTLSRLARTTFEDLHWGTLLTNVMHALSLSTVLDPAADLLKESRTVRLGDVGRAAGDPAAIVATGNHRIVVAFAGVGEVAVFQEGHPGQQRISAGKRPTVVAANPHRPASVYVADSFGDSVSVIDVTDAEVREPLAVISLGPSPAPNLADRGEQLFYDARLSHDGWMSCHSCHTDGHSNGLLNDNLGDGSFDAPKRVLSLLGVADTAPWAWNGGIDSLEAQIRKSVATTMRGPDGTGELTEDQLAALTAYLKTLAPAPPVRPAASDVALAAAKRGAEVFERIGCGNCHAPPTYTSADISDIGFVDEVGNTKFNPPSLRGVSQRAALFHNNRSQSLEEAVTSHRPQFTKDVPAADLADLVEFLRSL